jgi:hypothetical protein
MSLATINSPASAGLFYLEEIMATKGVPLPPKPKAIPGLTKAKSYSSFTKGKAAKAAVVTIAKQKAVKLKSPSLGTPKMPKPTYKKVPMGKSVSAKNL